MSEKYSKEEMTEIMRQAINDAKQGMFLHYAVLSIIEVVGLYFAIRELLVP